MTKSLGERAWVYVVRAASGEALHCTAYKYRAVAWIREHALEGSAHVEMIRGREAPEPWAGRRP